MTKDNRGGPVSGGCRTQQSNLDKRGYQPQSTAPLIPQALKPPSGGSSIQPPKSSGQEKKS